MADDDALLREGLASLLQDAGHSVVGRARDAPDLLLKVRSYVPDIAIVDVRMPPGNADDGLLAAAAIRREHASVSVLVLSQHVEPTYMLELVGDDASGVGYLLKDRVRDVAHFVEAVERVAAGGTAFDPAVVKASSAGAGRRCWTSSPIASATCSRCSPRAAPIARSPSRCSSARAPSSATCKGSS